MIMCTFLSSGSNARDFIALLEDAAMPITLLSAKAEATLSGEIAAIRKTSLYL